MTKHVTPNDYQSALDAQSACNLSGIVHSFSRIVSKIWDEARELGEGTDYVNRHPICRLFAEQIMYLSGGSGGFESFHVAYQTAKDRAKATE